LIDLQIRIDYIQTFSVYKDQRILTKKYENLAYWLPTFIQKSHNILLQYSFLQCRIGSAIAVSAFGT